MGMYCLNMMMIALELARENRVDEDVATKFFEHFLYIANALVRPAKPTSAIRAFNPRSDQRVQLSMTLVSWPLRALTPCPS